MAVIKMGRKRSWAAVVAASKMALPWARCLAANSTIKMAFLLASAMSSTIPICVYTLLSKPRIIKAMIVPSTARGTTRITAAGFVQLSYCAASTRNTRMMARANTRMASEPTFFSW